jgi:uncharacterized protein (TIGR03790 family)
MGTVIDNTHITENQTYNKSEGTSSISPRTRTSTRSQPEYYDLVNYDDVLIVRNLNSPISMQIADYFQDRRNIPDINIVNITTSTSETISRTGFENEIRTPVEDHIVNNGFLGIINYIVTTKGVPLRVAEADTSDDNWGQPWTIDRASVDAELALILGPFKNNIGDGWWINNPYFNPSPYEDFNFTNYGIFLVTRFTGYDWNDIKNLIDKPEKAAGRHGTFYLDVDPGRDGGGYQIGNDWLRSANATLTANNFSAYLDETNLFLTNNVSASGYASWGSNDGNYPKNSLLNPGFETDGNSDGVPDFWYFINDTGVGICVKNTTEIRSGTWSLRLTRNATNENPTYAGQNYTVKPDTRYYAVGFANLTGVTTDDGAHLQIIAYDSMGDVAAYYNGTTRTGTTTSWTSLGQVHFEPIDGITNISLNVVLSKSQGTVYFDDIRLYEIKPHNDWIPGAIAETFVSTGGRSFNYPTNYGQSLVADIIRDGVTGIKGYVYEPYLDAIAHPDILFDAYTQGFSAGDSYYMASAYLGWMDTMVCDPKMSPYNPNLIPDIEIAWENISFSDSTPQTGQMIEIFANIQNLGPSFAENIEVEFYVGDPQTGLFLGSKTIEIQGYDSNVTSVTWDTTGYLDSHNITVAVDTMDYIFESNETNNQAYRAITVNLGYPTAHAGSDGMVDEDSIFTFDGSLSTDNASIVNYTWDFQDGNFDYGITPSHAFTTSGVFSVILNVTNVYGLWDLDTVDITVNNVDPLANAGMDLAGSEGEQINFDGTGSSDTPSDLPILNYTWNFGDGNIGYGLTPDHTYEDNGIYVVTLDVRDDDGAISSDIVNVTLDNVAPQITPLSPQTVTEDVSVIIQIMAYDVLGDSLSYSDNSSLFEINSSTGAIAFTPKNEDVGDHLINITVADEDGGVSNIEFYLRVDNSNDPPVIVSQPVTEAWEGIQYEYQVEINDDDLNISVPQLFTYSLDSNPQGMEIDSSGRITWLSEESHVDQTYTVVVNVSDGIAFDLQTYEVYVNNVNDQPTITSNPVTIVNEDENYFYDVEADDVDLGDILTFSLDLAPEGMSIESATGEITWLPTNNDVGDIEVIVNVTDISEAFDLQEFTIEVSNTNDVPSLLSIGSLTAFEDQLFEYQINASDIDLNDILKFYDDSSLFQINKNSGLISFTPTNDDVGVYNIEIKVKDSAQSQDSEIITFTIVNTNDAPTLDFLSYWQLTQDEPFTVTVNAEDEDLDDTLTFSDNSTLFDIDADSGEISLTPSNDHVGLHRINISVSDKEGALDFLVVIFNIANINDPPEIDKTDLPDSEEPLDIKEGESFNLVISADDLDSEESLTYSDDTDLFNINSETGEISFTPKAKDAGTHRVKITVTDSEGESDEIFLTFKIEGEEKEGEFNLIWIVLILIISIIAILILLAIMKKRKGGSKEEMVDFEKQSNVVVQPPNQGKYPPPPPPDLN